MVYRKYRAQKLFDGADWHGSEKVLILNEKGAVVAIENIEQQEETIPVWEGVLCPGFINTHCHLELSHMKGKIPENTGMIGFIKAVMTQRNASIDEQIEAMIAAVAQMKQEGIVAVGDISNTALSASVKTNSTIRFHSFVEVSGFVPAGATMRYEAGLELLKQFKEAGISSGSLSLVPHAPYSVSSTLFEMIRDKGPHPIQTMHSQESMAEAEWIHTGQGPFKELFDFLKVNVDFYTGTGLKNSLQHSLPFFTEEPLILVHNVTTQEDELEWAFQHHPKGAVYFCLCPNANQYIGNGRPSIETILAKGGTLTLGTDSLASNHQLSIRAEMQLLKTWFPSIPVETLIQAATSNGAKALNMEDQLGSFAVGTTPGVNLVAEDFSSLTVIA